MSGYEVLAVRYASRVARAAEVYLNFHTYGEDDYQMRMDYFFWVVRDSLRSIVVDTGFTPEVGEARGRTMTCSVPEALNRLGLDPNDVDTVIVTHGHYDHTGNVALFKNASVVISDTELNFWSDPVARRFQFAMLAEWPDIDHLCEIEVENRIVRMVGSYPIAPGVTAIEVGGHTPGQLIVTVDGEASAVILASDSIHYYDEIELDRPFLFVADLPGMYRAYDTLSRLTASKVTAVVAGHDPIVLERFPIIDPADPGFAVRIG